MNRRRFLQLGLGAAIAGRFGLAHATAANPVIVQIFLRGGADALSVLPIREGANLATYTAGRPTIRIASPAALTAGNGFGMHPALARTRALYEGGEAAFVIGAGCANQTRSHFEQEAFIEGGDPVTRRATGYLNRALTALGGESFAARAIAIQDTMPLSLRGPSAALRVPSLDTYGALHGPGMTAGTTFTERAAELATPPAGSPAAAAKIRSAAIQLVDSLSAIEQIVAAAPAVSATSVYGTGELAANLRDAARIIAAEPRVRIVEVDAEKLDTHAMQGNGTGGALRDKLAEIDRAVGAFVDDAKRLGFWSRTVVMVISEFGRTVKETGSKGTDHGRGGVAWVVGPPAIVRGRRVLAPTGFSLAPAALVEGRDLPVTTDLRAITGEILTKHLGVPALDAVFPGWTPMVPGLLTP